MAEYIAKNMAKIIAENIGCFIWEFFNIKTQIKKQ
jgi:hypothetical protein